MIIEKIKNHKGFTLVETMFAIMILSLAIVGMMTVVASSLFASRYARDEITVNYLLQETVDYIRNDRDTSVFLQNTQTTDSAWDAFVSKYVPCSDPDTGCSFDVLDFISNPFLAPTECPLGGCPNLCYDEGAETTAFYVNANSFGNCDTGSLTHFQRKIVVDQNPTNLDELNITTTVYWQNGGTDKERSLTTTLMKWQ